MAAIGSIVSSVILIFVSPVCTGMGHSFYDRPINNHPRKLGKSVMSLEREERLSQVQRSSIVQLNDSNTINNVTSRDSWMFRDSVHLVLGPGSPSAPILEFVDEEDPPPSYQQAVTSSNK